MNWGHYIALTLIAFAIVIFSLVTISMKQDVSLVAPDYYKQEIGYQDQMDKITNYNSLSEPPTIVLNNRNNTLRITFPAQMVAKIVEGQVQLYRPSDAKDDQMIQILMDKDGIQVIPTTGMRKGLWKAKINFHMDSKYYYHEQNIIL